MNQMTLIALHSKSKFCQSEAEHELSWSCPSPAPPPPQHRVSTSGLVNLITVVGN